MIINFGINQAIKPKGICATSRGTNSNCVEKIFSPNIQFPL
jgi:hypothetical protein